MAKTPPIINQQTKKLAPSSDRSAIAPPTRVSVAVRLIPFLFLVGFDLVKYVLEQFPLLRSGAPTNGPYIQQCGQHGQSGEAHTSQPINDEPEPFQVRFEYRLAPNQHPGGQHQKKDPKPTSAGINRIDRHATSYHGEVSFPSHKKNSRRSCMRTKAFYSPTTIW